MKKFFDGKYKKSGLMVIFVLAVMLVISACGGGGQQAQEEKQAMALVNGVPITEKEFNQRLAIVAGQYQFDPNSPEQQEYRMELEMQILNSMIDEAVLLAEAQSRGLQVDPADLEQDMEMYRNSFSSPEEFSQYLRQYLNISEEEFAELLRRDKLVAMLFDDVTGHITEASQTPREYYEENKQLFASEEEAAATHILVQTFEEAQEIIALLRDGAGMNELAAARSIDPSAQHNGGDLGYFGRGDMVEPFDRVVFSMEVGTIHPEPVETRFGFHVIRLDDYMEAYQPTYEEVRDEIEFYLVDVEKNRYFEQFINQLRESAEIQVIKD